VRSGSSTDGFPRLEKGKMGPPAAGEAASFGGKAWAPSRKVGRLFQLAGSKEFGKRGGEIKLQGMGTTEAGLKPLDF
jgi:hypothetical protein